LTHGEQPTKTKKQRSVLIFKRESPSSARPRAFARFAQWLIRPSLQHALDLFTAACDQVGMKISSKMIEVL